jgi:beta-fructofuranosidase
VFDLEESWVWDFWAAHDGERFHVFFLQAPRSLGDPELRHHHASVGHAVSPELQTWTHVGDALGPQPPPAYDDLATWTGSVVRDDDGGWQMLTTGLSRADDGLVQRIGVSTSSDLCHWTRSPRSLVEADPRWYAVLGAAQRETHWRDPWVLRDENGVWHLLATARSPSTSTASVAHATSGDLRRWRVLPPLTWPSSRFGWAEVVSAEQVDGRWVLLFSCLSDQMPGSEAGAGGVWSLPVPAPASWGEQPCVDLDAAVRVTSERLYVGKVVRLPTGGCRMLAFVNRDRHGAFVGGLTDPLPVSWRADGRGLSVTAPAEWLPSPGA